ncbi:hypothetical protein MRBLWO14_001160 [Microbacterium sp. LWO14-1.2]|uniref:hypothetical protein n=1 Tax=Microbacterium sp. LWO14-1.2 TaxID=3135263 RepID=UPI00313927A9
MSESIALALIAGTQAILVAVIGVLGVRIGKVRRDTTATREQVVNHHETNFREENDSRHDETRGWFRDLRRDVGGIREDIRGLRADHRALSRRVDTIQQKGTP